MHLTSIDIKAGQTVKQGDILGVEGKAGTTDYHLHIELAADIEYPDYSPQVKGGNIIKKGTDSTVKPSCLFHVGYGQKIVKPTYTLAGLNTEDFAIPPVPEEIQLICKKCAEDKKLTCL